MLLEFTLEDRGYECTTREKAQKGLALVKEAIVETLQNHPEGLQNSQIADLLEIRSDYKGANKDYLSWSVIGLLFNAGQVERKGRKYFLVNGGR